MERLQAVRNVIVALSDILCNLILINQAIPFS